MFELAGPRLLNPFSRTLSGLHFGHRCSPCFLISPFSSEAADASLSQW
jgi:hypothetical protein